MPPKPTDLEMFKTRRDGLFERRGTWAEVTVGSKILGRSGRRGDVWEVIDSAIGNEPAEFGHTLWFKVRSLEDGREATIPPQWKKQPVTFLCESPDAHQPLPPVARASDADAVKLLLESFDGAVILASTDSATGEVECPDYAAGGSVGDNSYGRELINHMRIFHSIDAEGLDAKGRLDLHARAHNPKHPDVGKHGVPHRHVPEDQLLTMF